MILNFRVNESDNESPLSSNLKFTIYTFVLIVDFRLIP